MFNNTNTNNNNSDLDSVIDSLFEGFDDAVIYESGSYAVPGIYTVEINEIKLVQSAKEGAPWFFIVELRVLSSTNVDRPEGCTMSWSVNMTRKNTAFSNIKAFVRGILPDANLTEVNTALIKRLCAPEQEVAGTLANVEFYLIKTKAGNDFTKSRWSAYTAPETPSAPVPF